LPTSPVEKSRTHIDYAQLEPLSLHEGPYKNGYVLVVARPNYRLFVGQAAFTPTGSGMRWGRVRELRVDNVVVDSVETDSTARAVGVLVDFKCPAHARLYALRSEDDVAWMPAVSTLAVNAHVADIVKSEPSLV